jgi:hypothetical protein
VQKIFKLRFDNVGNQVYTWPQDVIDNTILAFATSATTASGYAGAAPTGRFFSPANGPNCMENENGSQGPVGNCGTGSLVVTGPLFQQHDIRFSKRTAIVGRVNFEFAAEMLNAFNQPNFLPISGITNNASATTIGGYQLIALQGTNQARVIQIVTRVNW